MGAFEFILLVVNGEVLLETIVVCKRLMADFALALHPGVLFVVPKEEHLMMVLFSSYG